MSKPEDVARVKIDNLLEAAGWILQDSENLNRNAKVGVAVREFQLPAGPCDYLLFVDAKAAGVIEAKKAGVTLSGVTEQSEKYMAALPKHLAKWNSTLLFDYESTGDETLFRDMRDPKPRSRKIFAFHRPEILHTWLKQSKTLRHRLRHLPLLKQKNLRKCQIEAIYGLEKSLSYDKPRELIQMATGAGKTFTACTFSYRLIKHGGAQRILFLVDRNNLGDQTLKEFQQFQPTGTAHRFTDTYIVRHLSSNYIDPDAKVVITTIQRLYHMLRNEELDIELEEESAFERWQTEEGEIQPIQYNPNIPIETFDFIITDECHRSIYGVWRQVLEYFDAHIIGLTATPTQHTLGFFNQNLVSEYPYERSVVDGVNVGFEIFGIRTKITEQGSKIKVEGAQFQVPVRDKMTRLLHYRILDADLEYKAKELDRSVVAPNQIRTVIECFKEQLFTKLFPERSGEWVPKTLIFAKDDSHAEEIVHIVREVFNEGNDFCKKITYRSTGEDPKTLIKAFRVDALPRIAVTVDMIATGTDIKPIEIVIFMRDVKSEGYYEQMKGRGVRTINDADLKQVTPDAQTKTRFILIDAVGVTEGKKNVSQPLERKKSISFDKLIDQIAQGNRDEDALSSLAGRLSALDKKLNDDDKEKIKKTMQGQNLGDISHKLLDAIEPDKQLKVAKERHGKKPSKKQIEAIAKELTENACRLFDNPEVRQILKELKQKSEIVIDDISSDKVLTAEFDVKQAKERIQLFKEFIEKYKDKLTALQIIYNQAYHKKKLTYAAIKELSQALTKIPYRLTTANVWQAYKRLNAAKVRGAPADRQLTEIVSLVRFALGMDKLLEPFGVKVEQRFNLWMGREKKQKRKYSQEQQEWLRAIAFFIAANAEIRPQDLMEAPSFTDKGGILKAQKLFGPRLNKMLDNLQMALVG